MNPSSGVLCSAPPWWVWRFCGRVLWHRGSYGFEGLRVLSIVFTYFTRPVHVLETEVMLRSRHNSRLQLMTYMCLRSKAVAGSTSIWYEFTGTKFLVWLPVQGTSTGRQLWKHSLRGCLVRTKSPDMAVTKTEKTRTSKHILIVWFFEYRTISSGMPMVSSLFHEVSVYHGSLSVLICV